MHAVEASSLNLFYGSNHAVKNMEMVIPKGSIFGLIGPNGSGKSTTMNMITTLLAPSSGCLRVLGFDVSEAADEVRRHIGLAPEEPALFSGLSAREFVMLSANLHGMDDQAAKVRCEQLLERFELSDRADDMLGSYSKGMKRKAIICACLIHDPDLMVLDEPLDGLDIFAQKTLKACLKEASESGKTVIYSTHILETVQGFCTHVGLLQQGEVLAHGPLDEVLQQLGVTELGDAFARVDRV